MPAFNPLSTENPYPPYTKNKITHNTHTIHTQYTHNTHTIHTQHTHNIHTIHTQHTHYTHNTQTIHIQYTHNTHNKHTTHRASTPFCHESKNPLMLKENTTTAGNNTNFRTGAGPKVSNKFPLIS